MDWQLILNAYLIGIPVWAFVLALAGEAPDYWFLVSVLIWPLAAISFAGQLIRKLFGLRPTK